MSAIHSQIDQRVFDAQMVLTDFHLGVSRILREHSARTETEMCQKLAAKVYLLEQQLEHKKCGG